MGKGKGIPDEFEVDADVQVGVNATTDMTADMSTDSTMRFPDAIRTEMTSDSTMRFPDAIRTEMAVTEPIRTEMDMVQRMAITEPIRTEMEMDLKPVVVDLCLNLGINKLPRTCIKRPYHHRVAISLLGTEVAALSLDGNREVIIDDLDDRPSVTWGTEHAVKNPKPPPSDGPDPVDPPDGGHRRPGGLRIDLGH